MDAVLSEPADLIMVCALKRGIAEYPFDLAHRARRATGLPVLYVPIPEAGVQRERTWARLWRGECGVTQRLTAPGDVLAA
jgi:hypothetical protein